MSVELFYFKAWGACCRLLFQSTSQNWSESWQWPPWAVIPPWVGGWGNWGTEQWPDLGAQSTASSNACSVLWTFWITLFSPCWLALFQVILFLHCFNIFLPETSHLLIYLTDKKLCVQLTKAAFGCIHPYPSSLFSSNSWWPFFDFYYLLRSGRIRPLSWSELWNT